jgi:hypothetical protein
VTDFPKVYNLLSAFSISTVLNHGNGVTDKLERNALLIRDRRYISIPVISIILTDNIR